MVDPIKAAKGIFDQFLSKADPASMPDGKSGEKALSLADAPISVYMAQIGSQGGKVGGKRRLETMTKEQRRKNAVKAARARWKKSKGQGKSS